MGNMSDSWNTDTGACHPSSLSFPLLRLQVLKVLVLLPMVMLPAHSSVVWSPDRKASSHVPIPYRPLSPAPVKRIHSSFTHPYPPEEPQDIPLQGFVCALRSSKSPLMLGNFLLSQGHLHGFKLREDKTSFKRLATAGNDHFSQMRALISPSSIGK